MQLREIEIILGLKDEDRISCAGRFYREAFIANGDDKTHSFDTRLKEKSLKDLLVKAGLLNRTGLRKLQK